MGGDTAILMHSKQVPRIITFVPNAIRFRFYLFHSFCVTA